MCIFVSILILQPQNHNFHDNNQMQTTINYQYQAPSQARPIRYVLSGGLKQKYSQLPQLEQILRSTQKCPFTSIRQLIISFKRTDPFTSELPECDLLREKYHSQPHYQQIAETLNHDLREVQESRIRFGKLEACLEQYNGLFGDMKREAVGHDEGQGNQPKFQYDYRVYRKRNQAALDKESKYFQYLTFSQEFERAIILASASQSQRFKPKQSFERIDNFRLLSDKSQKIASELRRLQSAYINHIFTFRQFIKHGSGQPSESQRQKLESDLAQMNREIDGIYTQMSDFGTWLERDRREMRSIYEGNRNAYRIFLPEFVKVKEAYEISSRNSFYYEVIREEKSRLEAHMRKNYGLIVPYSVSPQFTKAITPIQHPKNRQLKSLIQSQITPLQDAILYINNDYQKLYKEVCDSRDSSQVRRKIEGYIGKWNMYVGMADQNNGFAGHLIESCQKLLRIAK